MSESFSHRRIFKPGHRVAVFPFDAASGATIGYYGTVIEAEADSVRQNPVCPNAWRYRIATVAGMIDAEGCNIIPIRSYASTYLRKDDWPEYELRFESSLLDDNDEIEGCCRLAKRIVGYFRFRKEAQQLPTYQLKLPTLVAGRPWRIKFRVPAEHCLNRDFVVRTLAEVLGADSVLKEDAGA